MKLLSIRTFAVVLLSSLLFRPTMIVASESHDEVIAIELTPAEVALLGPRSQHRFVVTGLLPGGELIDVTDQVTFSTSDTARMTTEDAVALPLADGATTLTATLGPLSATARVDVVDHNTPQPVSFQTEVLAALTKAGCNMGACHGSPSGKAGFRLSLRGYDPLLDILTLRGEFQGRRANLIDPDTSLMLKKPLMEVSHAGGRRMHHGDAVHGVLRQWIAEGLRLDAPDTATLQSIVVLPGDRVFHETGNRQQLVVRGRFSNGTQRDVTPLTVFSSSDETVANVSEEGLVRKTGRGEAAILARYLDKMDTVNITFLEDVPGFRWSDPGEVNFIDRLVNGKLRQLQVLPSGLCSDDEFVRRAFLDAAGRLPTSAETREFQNEVEWDKRSRLIDRLLESPDHASFWTLHWADVLRTNTGKLTSGGVAKFHRWIYEGILADVPMNEFARDLLTATGSVFENPAANFWRSSRDPQDAAETTAQLFLGIRIQCAKCHNHPFERWTQDNYYGIGAAFARVDRKTGPRQDEEVIFLKSSGDVVQPRTGVTMPVHLLLQGDADIPPEQDRREVFADWLTAPDNPFFARAVVNRIWGHLLGRGIVHPVDDFRDSNPPSNARLLDELAQQFVEHGYSRKWLIRQIMNSQTYQRSAVINDFNADDARYFSHVIPRMLSAEQLLDAVCQVTGVPESFRGQPAGTRATELPEPPSDNDFLKVFGQPQREMACECERSGDSNLSQALQMINGPTVHDKLRADTGTIHRLIGEGQSDEAIVAGLYLSAVCREPSSEELETALKHVASSQDRQSALEDIGWAVLNSKEFLFQH